MKKIFIALGILTGCTTLAFTFQQNKIAGRWESKMPDNTIVGVIYKPNRTYQAYVNKKVFVTGNYELKNDTLSIKLFKLLIFC